MRVTITNTPTSRGLIFKTHYHALKVAIEFSPAELSAIEDHNLWKAVVYERDTKRVARQMGRTPEEKQAFENNRYGYKILLKGVVKDGGFGEICDNLADAQQVEAKIRNEVLPALKNLITHGRYAGHS